MNACLTVKDIYKKVKRTLTKKLRYPKLEETHPETQSETAELCQKLQEKLANVMTDAQKHQDIIASLEKYRNEGFDMSSAIEALKLKQEKIKNIENNVNNSLNELLNSLS